MDPNGAKRGVPEAPPASESDKAVGRKASPKRKAPARTKAKTKTAAPRSRKTAAATKEGTADRVKSQPARAGGGRRRSAQATVTRAPADIEQMIATAAYFLAEKRHFAPGYELEDWIAAEHEIRRRQASRAA